MMSDAQARGWDEFVHLVPPPASIAGGADLHVHTSASDGTRPPREVVQRAAGVSLEAVAITDHDTLGGVSEALLAGREYGVVVVPGVEVSTRYRGEEVHVLGYFVDPDNDDLCQKLTELRDSRLRRAGEMVARLHRLGVDIALEEVLAEAAEGSIGRPHMARVLHAHGYVASTNEAFDRFLARGRPAYVPRMKVTPQEALDLLHGAGAAVCLAHPGLTEQPGLVAELLKLNFDAVEVRHSEHSREMEYQLWCMAQQAGVAVTGGSDWHGVALEGPKSLGGTRVPLAWVTDLRGVASHYPQKDSHRGS